MVVVVGGIVKFVRCVVARGKWMESFEARSCIEGCAKAFNVPNLEC